MTTITVLPEGTGNQTFRASAGGKVSTGRTLGEALDALTPQLPDADTDMHIVVRRFRPDRFFNAQQQQQMAELMDKLRLVREGQATMTPEEMREAEELVEAELRGAVQRTEAIFGNLPE